MKACGGTLAALLASKSVPLLTCDLYTVTLADGVTTFYWSSGVRDLTWNTHTFQGSGNSGLVIKRGKWSIEKTVQVTEMGLAISCKNDPFNGGLNFKLQAHNGLFAGSTWNVEQAFMVLSDPSTVVDTIVNFNGQSGPIALDGMTVNFIIRGANNVLVMDAPRNVYQLGCIHTLYDAGCTLIKASFTTSYSVGASPTRILIPWAAVPGTPSRYNLGIIKMTSGAASGQSRFIRSADASGIVPVYPFYTAPAPGDTFTASEGCDKTRARCVALSNEQHWRAFPYTPDATQAV